VTLYFRLYPANTPNAYVVDRRFVKELLKHRWKHSKKINRARAVFSGVKRETRKYLHRYILTLIGRHYPEVCFADGDSFNCTLVNLKPYRRYEEGAFRKRFRNNKSGVKGVYFNLEHKKWMACIKYKGKLKHLGYFSTVEEATRMFDTAFKLVHLMEPKR
jgi:hypothetical protein